METLTELASALEAAQKAERFAPARIRRAREREAARLEARRAAWHAENRRHHPEDYDPETGEHDPFRTFGDC